LRIIVTNHGLRKMAGTELATFELAQALRELGHEVGVFSPFLGRFAFLQAWKNQIPVFSLGDSLALKKFNPDVIHLQHWPNHLLLDEMGIHAPRLFHFHGASAPLESPPRIKGYCPPWIAVSDITFSSVAEDSGWDAKAGSRISKWGASESDYGRSVQPLVTDVKLKNVLVVSNHFPALYSEWVIRAGRELGFNASFIGEGNKVKPVTDTLLVHFDAVVSLGRTAVQSATLGIPTLLLDHLGLDGWVTPLNYKDLESTGFSGSYLKDTGFSYENLLNMFRNPPTPQDLAEVALIFKKSHSLAVIAKQIETHLKLASTQQQDFTFERSAYVAANYITQLWLTENRKFAMRKIVQRVIQRRLIRNFYELSTNAYN
jgi:hypothetical protein